MRNRLMGVYLACVAFAVLAGCASAEAIPDTVTVADTAVAPAPDRGNGRGLVAAPGTVAVPAVEVVPEPAMAESEPAAEDTSTVDATAPADDPTPEPDEDTSEPEYVSPEDDLPVADEDAIMDCVDWAQADGLAYEDAAALCDALSRDGYPTSGLTHEEYEQNFTDQAQQQGL